MWNNWLLKWESRMMECNKESKVAKVDFEKLRLSSMCLLIRLGNKKVTNQSNVWNGVLWNVAENFSTKTQLTLQKIREIYLQELLKIGATDCWSENPEVHGSQILHRTSQRNYIWCNVREGRWNKYFDIVFQNYFQK